MFGVNNKNTRTTSVTSFWCLYCWLWICFTPFSSVSIVCFVVFVCWVDTIRVSSIGNLVKFPWKSFVFNCVSLEWIFVPLQRWSFFGPYFATSRLTAEVYVQLLINISIQFEFENTEHTFFLLWPVLWSWLLGDNI